MKGEKNYDSATLNKVFQRMFIALWFSPLVTALGSRIVEEERTSPMSIPFACCILRIVWRETFSEELHRWQNRETETTGEANEIPYRETGGKRKRKRGEGRERGRETDRVKERTGERSKRGRERDRKRENEKGRKKKDSLKQRRRGKDRGTERKGEREK